MTELVKKQNKYIWPGVLVVFLCLLAGSLSISDITPLSVLSSIVAKEYPSVVNFGDVMFDRGVRNIIDNRNRDPFEYIKKDLAQLQDYDIFIANLEGPIVTMDRTECQNKAYNFQFADDTTDRLKSIGINMVSIANNHNFDCYRVGFESTKKNLLKAGIDYIGERSAEKSFLIKTVDGKNIAFVGIDQVTAPFPVSNFYPLIKKLKAENDYVVVNIHWGEEYKLVENSKQRDIAHKLIDSGVDVIFGHHPHVIEPVEVYKSKVIFYSLGNFVFDQDFGDTKKGLGAGVEFQDDKKVFTLFPFDMKKFAPDLMKGEDLVKFCENYLAKLEHESCTFELKV